MKGLHGFSDRLTDSVLVLPLRHLRGRERREAALVMLERRYPATLEGKRVVIIKNGKRQGESDGRGRLLIPVLDGGEHELVFEKRGYETVRDVAVLDSLLVLYCKMRSAEQLLRAAEELLDGGRAAEAEELLEHALEAGAGVDAEYLFCVALMMQGMHEDALERLSGMERSAVVAEYIAALEGRLTDACGEGAAQAVEQQAGDRQE